MRSVQGSRAHVDQRRTRLLRTAGRGGDVDDTNGRGQTPTVSGGSGPWCRRLRQRAIEQHIDRAVFRVDDAEHHGAGRCGEQGMAHSAQRDVEPSDAFAGIELADEPIQIDQPRRRRRETCVHGGSAEPPAPTRLGCAGNTRSQHDGATDPHEGGYAAAGPLARSEERWSTLLLLRCRATRRRGRRAGRRWGRGRGRGRGRGCDCGRRFRDATVIVRAQGSEWRDDGRRCRGCFHGGCREHDLGHDELPPGEDQIRIVEDTVAEVPILVRLPDGRPVSSITQLDRSDLGQRVAGRHHHGVLSPCRLGRTGTHGTRGHHELPTGQQVLGRADEDDSRCNLPSGVHRDDLTPARAVPE